MPLLDQIAQFVHIDRLARHLRRSCGLFCLSLIMSSPAIALGPDAYLKVSAGSSHTCAILATGGAIDCWGLNDVGQLGNGSTTSSSHPARVSGITGATAIATGFTHSCAVVSGSVKCWGFNGAGQLGNNSQLSSLTPVSASGISNAVSVGVGEAHTCAALASGAVMCWGSDFEGQLGTGVLSPSGFLKIPTPIQAGSVTGAVKVVAGEVSTCAMTSAGGVFCWGNGSIGQLGNGGTNSRTPVANGITTALDLAMGKRHACALLSDANATLACWGDNSTGQLGNGTLSPSLVPEAIIQGVTAVATGGNHTCVTGANLTMACWGFNQFGALGDGTLLYSVDPVLVTGITTATPAVAAGGLHSCVIIAGGALRCWGSNAYGQLGDGTVAFSATAVSVVGISAASGISVGGYNACALMADGTVRCWGAGGDILGSNGTGAQSNTPVIIAGLAGATQVSVGSGYACALVGGAVWCWGRNDSGQLGRGTASSIGSSVPTAVAGIASAVHISTGNNHACAALGDTTVKCWGQNQYLKLGVPSGSSSATPVAVVGLTGATQVSASAFHSCAIVTGGGVRCWGFNGAGQASGQVGVPSSFFSTPTTVAGISGATSIATSDNNTCVVTPTSGTSGPVQCWGSNAYEQLGVGTPVSSPSTINTVTGVTNATAVTAASFHACAQLATGAVQCWGNATLGEGSGAAVGTVTRVSTGQQSTCAVSGGGVRCIGSNGFGQLGDGTGPVPTPLAKAVLPGTCSLDIDGDGTIGAATDGVMLVRAAFGITGSAVTSGAIGANAVRRVWDDVGGYLTVSCKIGSSVPPGACSLDLDGDGQVRGTTDGLMLIRIALGLPGNVITAGAVASAATRPNWTAIRSYLSTSCGLTGLPPAP